MEEPNAMKTTPVAIAVDRIHANSWNPNSMKPEIFEALVEDIKRNGFLGAILVRNCSCRNFDSEHFEIVDGEHRWLASQDRRIDLHKIPCYIVERDDISARVETVTRNREHGDFVREKLVKLIGELKGPFSLREEDIRARMMIPEAEFSLILNPVNMKPEPVRKLELHGRRPSFTVTASISSKEQYDMITGMLDTVMQEEQCDKGHAMVKVFTAFRAIRNDTVRGEG
ncbi:MAG: ParB N-terminal domain-containing protein [Thaumarchaeota archaeon]|nr:ParB N-terminal domain-containing protein [Nitrososphaerota archaeon]